MKKIISLIAILTITIFMSGCGNPIDFLAGDTGEYSYTCQLDIIGSGDETIRDIDRFYLLDDYIKFTMGNDELVYVKHDIVNVMICEKVENTE